MSIKIDLHKRIILILKNFIWEKFLNRQKNFLFSSISYFNSKLNSHIIVPKLINDHEELKDLFVKYFSDKSTRHNYHQIYGNFIGNLRGNILEIGLGGKGSFKYSSGVPGGSLLAMAEFNTGLKIFGGDINPKSVNAVNFQAFEIDQTLDVSILEFSSKMQKFSPFSMIIDDGHHQFESNVKTFFGLRSLLKPGGFYVIEDVHESHLELWNIFIDCNNLKAQIFDLRTYRSGIKDNILILINF